MERQRPDVVGLLEQDELANCWALDMLRRFSTCEFRCAPAEAPRAVAVSRDGASEWHVAAYALRPLMELAGELPSRQFACYVHQAWILDVLQNRYALGSRASFMKLTASEGQFRPVRDPAVVRLGEEHLGALKASVMFSEIAERVLDAPAAFGVIRDGTVVGKVDVQERTDMYWEVNELVVAPEHRQQGLGTALGSAAVRFIFESGRLPIYTAFAQNSASVLLAERLGFACACTVIRQELSLRSG
jgi:GNAT superfamily N-acetyltransferase